MTSARESSTLRGLMNRSKMFGGAAPGRMEVGIPNMSPTGSVNGLLARVLARQNILVVYQPIKDLASGRTVGFEALARPMNLGEESEVGGFFAAAERLGVIRDLDWLCRRAAVAGMVNLPENTFLSINVSPESLVDNPAMDAAVVMELIGSSPHSPHDIVLEVQLPPPGMEERFLMACQEYRACNLRIAVSGVDPEHSIPIDSNRIDIIKLSRDLPKRLDVPAVKDYVAALVKRADGKVGVVAEGIEDEWTAAILERLGVTMGQGFYLGRPAAVEKYLPSL